MTPVPAIHAVTDDRVLAFPDFLARARALALGPHVAIHLRGRLDGGPLLALADQVRALTAESRTRLLIHDRLDVAQLCGADGVHLPAYGLPVAAARRALGPDTLIGRSTHSAEEARAALDEGADFAFLGPIWPTASHPDRPALGTAALSPPARADSATSPPHPIIAIGALTPARAAEARAAGAMGVAAITALWDAPDPAAAVRDLWLSFTSCSPPRFG